MTPWLILSLLILGLSVPGCTGVFKLLIHSKL